MRELIYLNGGNFANLDFLQSHDAIIERAKKTQAGTVCSQNTYKNRLTAVLAALTLTGLIDTATYEFYKQKFDETREKLDAIAMSGVKSDKEKAAWKPATELRDILSKLKTQATRKDVIVPRDDKLNYFLLSLYLTLPPRRLMDYESMKIIRGAAPQNLPTTANYFLVDKMVMVYNVHKTAAKRGTEFLFIDKDIEPDQRAEFMAAFDVYKTALKPLPRTAKYTISPLLQHANGVQLTEYAIRTRLYNMLGSGVGVSMIRKILSTDEDGIDKATAEKLLKTASKMGHDVKTHIRYYVKSD
jgi:hypothetical protein